MPKNYEDEALKSKLNFYLLVLVTLTFALRLIDIENLPFSLSLDEAINGLDALYLWRLSELTPFLQNNFGRETLFFYFQALALQLYGISIFALRLPAVLAGTLAIPLLYQVGRQMQIDKAAGETSTGGALPMGALLAATGLALSYWHLYFSRQGLRANLYLPLLLALAWCFWRGWSAPPAQRTQWHWFGLAGLLLGLTFYTYLAARLLPLFFVIFILVEGIRRNALLRQHWVHLLLFGLTTLGTILPLGIYFYQNPQALASRTQAISIFATDQPLTTLLNNGLALLHLHFWGNSWLERWPALNLLAALGLFAGLLTCIYHIRKPASLFLLLWWSLGNLPVLFSIQDWSGQTTLLRGITAWPATFLIMGMGWVAIGKLVSFQAGVRRLPAWGTLGLLLWLFLLLSGGTTLYQYFVVWPALVDHASDHPLYMARYLNRQQSQLTLVPLTFYRETVTHFLLQERYPRLENLTSVTWETQLASGRPIVYLLPYQDRSAAHFILLAPAEAGVGTAYLLPPLSPGQVEEFALYTENSPPPEPILDSEQEVVARAYPLGTDHPLVGMVRETIWKTTPVSSGIEIEFDQTLRLESYQIEPRFVKPGETLTLTLTWQAQQPVDGDYYLFIHLFEAGQKQRYGQVNLPLTGILFEAHRWPPGLSVPDIHRFTLPAGASEGLYHFELGLYHAASQQRLPVHLFAAESAPIKDDKVLLGKIWLQQYLPARPTTPLSQAQFGEMITLAGADLPQAPVSAGQVITYTLYWQATALIPQNYTVFAHLLDSDGILRAQRDHPLQQGHYPATIWWEAGDQIINPRTLTLPSDLEPGVYTLRVGLYHPETRQRLLLQNGEQDFVDLPASITIQP